MVEQLMQENLAAGKTAFFKLPKSGVVRSSRGTVELLVHKNGRTFRPNYNKVGILLRVDVSDGFALVRSTNGTSWQMLDKDGESIENERIHTVAFDKRGNLWYETVGGRKVVFHIDGNVEISSTPGSD